LVSRGRRARLDRQILGILDRPSRLGYAWEPRMKASVRWLRELCPELPDDAKAIGERLTAAGLEVESASAFGLGAEACVIASVVATRPHPSRSGLRLVTVHNGTTTQEVVCGAPNVPEAGGLVVLAPIGAHLPAKGMTIEKRSIAGVPSEGMLCSEAELGVGEDEAGILVLSAGAASPGTRLVDAIPAARDTILEIGLTPNRPDGLGHVGLAREAAALFNLPFVLAASTDPERRQADLLANHLNLTIDDADRCPHYAAALLTEVRVARSPLDVRFRLASLGVRSISNVVDATNMVMLEFGHPMHAFDLDKIRGRAIVVRRARTGERLRTLDGVERALEEDDLVVCDGVGPLALAGVMGGETSEIAHGTERVLLECAYFDPRSVRRTARRHGLHTESSHRFERGIDWGDTRAALARGVSLIARLATAVAIQPARVIEAKALARRTVTLRQDRVRALLGTVVESTDAHGVLERLGFSRRASQPGAEVWEVPSFRPDVSREVDLIEEIGRVRGYDTIPTSLPPIRASRDAGPRQALARRAREAAVACGLSEAVTYAFVRPADLEAVGAPAATVTLKNPLHEDHSVMRTSLLPGLLRALARAERHGQRDARLFTVGATFLASLAERPGLPDERLALTVLVAGDRAAWLHKPEPVDVWDAKGLAEGLVARILRRAIAIRVPTDAERPRALHPRGAAWIDVDNTWIGSFGPLHPDVADAFEIAGAAVVIDLDLGAIQTIGAERPRFAPLPRFPSSARDVALVVAEGVAAGEVESAAREVAGELADQVVLFDRFTGGVVAAGHASLGVHIVYRAPDRTLTDAEVDARHREVLSALETRFGATLRT
jgi:phenylalanyl-tRNA synthetase beta chain